MPEHPSEGRGGAWRAHLKHKAKTQISKRFDYAHVGVRGGVAASSVRAPAGAQSSGAPRSHYLATTVRVGPRHPRTPINAKGPGDRPRSPGPPGLPSSRLTEQGTPRRGGSGGAPQGGWGGGSAHSVSTSVHRVAKFAHRIPHRQVNCSSGSGRGRRVWPRSLSTARKAREAGPHEFSVTVAPRISQPGWRVIVRRTSRNGLECGGILHSPRARARGAGLAERVERPLQ